ncbi:MAG: hypothetical protein GKR94_27080 [Gammaproteobacteria bacterium]|nr:hypothetical protein [Gammaproteobacteria bacterium]
MKHISLSVFDYVLIVVLNSLLAASIYMLRDGMTLAALIGGVAGGETTLVFIIDWVITLFLFGCAYLGGRALIKSLWPRR